MAAKKADFANPINSFLKLDFGLFAKECPAQVALILIFLRYLVTPGKDA